MLTCWDKAGNTNKYPTSHVCLSGVSLLPMKHCGFVLFSVLILWSACKCTQISRQSLLWKNTKVWCDTAGTCTATTAAHRCQGTASLGQGWGSSPEHAPPALFTHLPSFSAPVNIGLSTPSEATFKVIEQHF